MYEIIGGYHMLGLCILTSFYMLYVLGTSAYNFIYEYNRNNDGYVHAWNIFGDKNTESKWITLGIFCMISLFSFVLWPIIIPSVIAAAVVLGLRNHVRLTKKVNSLDV